MVGRGVSWRYGFYFATAELAARAVAIHEEHATCNSCDPMWVACPQLRATEPEADIGRRRRVEKILFWHINQQIKIPMNMGIFISGKAI